MIPEQLAACGLSGCRGAILTDASPAVLIEKALANHEGILTSTGALAVETGKYTGRSPHDRFIVDTPDVHDDIAWGSVNMPFSIEGYEKVRKAITDYLKAHDLYIVHAIAGADRRWCRKFLVVCERASQALFARQLLVRPSKRQLADFDPQDFSVLVAPGLKLDPAEFGTNSEAAVLINFQRHEILIAGTQYSGEIKKSVFSVMNYLMPVEENVLPMHSSANMDPVTGETAVFFGLSGTGKTTLSADPQRMLIGDDEHGWSEGSVFNFEGGCYAKAIRISAVTEPEIFHAIRFGAMCENVTVDNVTRKPDYFNGTLTENTRVAYPIDYIDNAQVMGQGRYPNVIIFLTADAFGVLPPIARLDKNAAMYHFLSGFTSKVAGTERGVTEPQPTFSTLFGEPFMPLSPLRYARMFGEKMSCGGTRVYLINTGWTGGPYGIGSRMDLASTRLMVSAALDGSVEEAEFAHDPIFNVDVPQHIEGVDSRVLNPRNTWSDKNEYDRSARALAQMFVDNAAEKYPDMAAEVRAAGPMPA
ncbi:phosphoenolpyruvate carboxykinase (ATP) [Olsenella uli DSM 7084]|uniref:Phosphoenolpyruvate carboxykinase (ATP) n=1 Tax=Olsenella uli (strain ATCC 49627 / DSM 7084 / CCUG 31166 / CIP 109912 / JCM 12494 / LMG 11480 / NCIMB 702895 / VPI D76D-27C) TaxID=633147 RepID=E1QZX3_OLSUV|nr:phosphoenolpyruvate carboxykinase (ATP) [Olsenella uli]ADK67937.1 phosphoenolpyruvate carboxykinase (ATP) [Olsenella uli DSM 7084]